MVDMDSANFEWDDRKDLANCAKHGVSFHEAQTAFLDADRLIAEDIDHSTLEKRYYCFGKVGSAVMTVRFTYTHLCPFNFQLIDYIE